jgi:hypothetical protein
MCSLQNRKVMGAHTYNPSPLGGRDRRITAQVCPSKKDPISKNRSGMVVYFNPSYLGRGGRAITV